MKIPQLKQHTPVYISWVDSVTESGWQYGSQREKKSPPNIHSVGYVIATKRDSITIAHSFDRDSALGLVTIPAGAVVKLKKIKLVNR